MLSAIRRRALQQAERSRRWVVDRFGLGPVWRHFLDRRVAKGSWYYGDGATLLTLLGVMVATGALMTLTYSPSPDTAFDSVVAITREQPLGNFIRGLHYWTAGLMVVMLFSHLFRILLVGGYKSPREGTYYVGVGMFVLVLTMAFTGYVLRWDTRAMYAIRVVLHMFNRVPLLGDELAIIVQGGTEIGARTLSRFFSVHVVMIPLLLLALAGWHLYLVVLHGTTSLRERREPVPSAEAQRRLYDEQKHSDKYGEMFFPETTAKSGGMALVVFLVAVALAVILGPPLPNPEANLVETVFPMEEWWYAWYSTMIALLPPWLAVPIVVLLPLFVLGFLLLLPLLDRSPWRGVRKRPIFSGAIVVTAALLVVLSEIRIQSPWTGWPREQPPTVPPGIELTELAERGRQLFADKGCTSCHAVAGDGRKVGPDFARSDERLSRKEIREFVLEPERGTPMPAYEGRLTDAELGALVEYVLVAQTFEREQR